MSLPFLTIAVTNASPSSSRTHSTFTGPTPGISQRLARRPCCPAASASWSIDRRASCTRRTFASPDHRSRRPRTRRPRRRPDASLVLRLARLAKRSARPVLDHGLDRAADLGRDLEVAFDHPVGGRPHPERPLPRADASDRSAWSSRARPHRDALVPQRHDARSGGFNSCRSTDGSSAATDTIRSACRDDNVPARIAASVAGSDSSFPATSIARFASPGRDTDQPFAQLRRVPIALVRRTPRCPRPASRPWPARRRSADADDTELLDRPRSLRRRCTRSDRSRAAAASRAFRA